MSQDSALLLADSIISISQGGTISQHKGSGIPNVTGEPETNEPETRSSRALSLEDDANTFEHELAASLPGGTTYPKESRRRNDLQVYHYYVSKIGYTSFLAFLTCCAGQVVGFYIPRK